MMSVEKNLPWLNGWTEGFTSTQWRILQSYGHYQQYIVPEVLDNAEFEMAVIVVGRVEYSNRSGDGSDISLQAGQVLLLDACTGKVKINGGASLLRLGRQSLLLLEQDWPDVAAALYTVANGQQQINGLLVWFKRHFGPLNRSDETLLLQHCHWQTLSEGAHLANAGDSCEHWYVVLHGTLSGFSPQTDHQQRASHQWQQGDFFGHAPLLSTGEHQATIIAVTEVKLAVLDRKVFDYLWQKRNRFKTVIASDLAQPYRQLTGNRSNTGCLKIALLALSSINDIATVSDALAQTITPKPARVVNFMELAKYLGVPVAAGRNAEHPAWYCIYNWLTQYQGRYLMLLAEPQFAAWQKFCLGNSDILLGLGQGNQTPATMPSDTWSHFNPRFGCQRWLILLHQPETTMPTGTRYWLHQFEYPRHLHLRLGHVGDTARVMRTVLGQGIGVVFGGGHARCFAQLGVIEAMKTHGISVDMIGGTSFGALLAAHIALEQTHAEIEASNVVLRKLKPFRAIRWPRVSLIGGKKFDWLAVNTFGDYDIEDFWLPYFCISTNLTTAQEVVHDSGAMSQAARATGSVPILIAPARQGNEILVDGGLVNNLPVDVMRRKTAGPIIAIDVSTPHPMRHCNTEPHCTPPQRFKWLKRWLKLGHKEPSIVSIADRSMSLISLRKMQTIDEKALLLKLSLPQYGMTEFDAMAPLVQLGYEQGLRGLAKFKEQVK